MRFLKYSLLFSLTMSLCVVAAEPVRTSRMFWHNMVLQQGKQVPVWGTAEPGDTVTVEFAGQKKSSKADENGSWMIKLDPLAVSTNHQQMQIKSEHGQLEYKNILVGEVWVCAGQSNMELRMWDLRADREKKKTPLTKDLESKGNPLLRHLVIQRALSYDTPLDSLTGSWNFCVPATIQEFSAVGYYFGHELTHELGVPVGLIKIAWGGTPVESWTRREVLEGIPSGKKYIRNQEEKAARFDPKAAEQKYQEALKQWQTDKDAAKAEGKEFKKRKPFLDKGPNYHPHFPSTLYNGMVNPAIPYAIAGVIWYQGENNTNNDKGYQTLFSAMIKDWRKQWGQGDFPFYFVQLANWRNEVDKPVMDSWGVLRECQRKTLQTVPNTGMAVTIDLGVANDIHPRNKLDVGKRLACWALNKTYGKQNVVYSGPLFKSAKPDGNKMIVRFDSAADGLVAARKADMWAPVIAKKEPLNCFQICGKDGVWKNANAAISGKDTVEVWEESIEAPVKVRYATTINPKNPNLYNKASLPASPFSSE